MSAPQPFSHKRALRAGFASFVGTAIEFYDFYVFATAAALIFGPLFFPEVEPALGVLASFATYATGFLVRPIGGVIFGHIGDRIGRRQSLVLTLLLMGVATMLVGFLPTFASVGFAAPIMLVALRMLQGLAVGGEWGGAVLMAVENAPEKYKSFYGSFPQLGNPMGALLASGIFALLTLGGREFMLDWGWRIPFLLSAILIGIGFWVRLKVEETPVFEEAQARRDATGKPAELPAKLAFKRNWRAIIIGVGLIAISSGGYYITTTFATAYATGETVGLDPTTVLNAMTFASFFHLLSTLPLGIAADRWGRTRVMAIGLVVAVFCVIPTFLVMGQSTWLLFLFLALSRVTMNATWAPLAAIMSQMFDADSRQTSLSISYSIGSALWGGLSPLVATGLFIMTGSIWSVIGFYILLTVVALVCLVLAPQLTDDIADASTEDVAPSAGSADSAATIAR